MTSRIMEAWVDLAWKNSGTRLTLNEREAETILRETHLEEPQIVWAIGQYTKLTLYPSVADFRNWLQGIEVPSTLMAIALQSEDPTAIGLAEELQTLQGAWFPTEDTVARKEELEQRLKALV